jgi:hypothetical protein
MFFLILKINTFNGNFFITKIAKKQINYVKNFRIRFRNQLYWMGGN